MNRQLVFVHGRSQENKNPTDLKAQWIDAWKQGLAKHGLKVPIADADIRFPYYGQTLHDLVKDKPANEIAEVIVRGEETDEREAQFVRSILLDIQKEAGITDEQVAAFSAESVAERGPLNWKWVRSVLKAIDTHVPGASSTSISVATRDVYLYLKNPGFQAVIDGGVKTAVDRDAEIVMVGHSLGSVVSYNILRRDGKSLGWKVPLYVTLGSPLAVTAIKDALQPIKHPECVTKWFNAMDSRDFVALYPLDSDHFRLTPPIENKINVDNTTENRHGISGYLSDAVVAKRIYDALTQ